MTSPFLQKINNIKNEFFMIFWKKYVPSDEIKLRDEITRFDGTIALPIQFFFKKALVSLQR